MATLETEIETAFSPSPTPPPIPSSSNGTNGVYRQSSPGIKQATQLIDGAPTKEHRLVEYFLVISYGQSLKIRHRSPLMDIFDKFHKRAQHHHAYIVQPKQSHKDSKHRKHRRKRPKIKDINVTETKEDDMKHNAFALDSIPRTISANTDTSITDYTNIEHIRRSSESFIQPNDNPFGSLRFEPSVIDRFPPIDHQDTAITSTDTQLQYFCLPTGLFLTKFPSLPIFYTFVWTPESGEHLYGCCLRFFEPVDPSTIYEFCSNTDTIRPSIDCNIDHLKYLSLNDCTGYFAPKCICIISYHSFIGAYRTFLTELYRLSLTPSIIPIERYLCNFFLECPLPPRGYFSVRYNIGDKSFIMARAPSNNPLSKSSISTRVLFELFTIDVIITIYKAILLEEKLLFISTQYSILSVIIEIFVSLLYPFTWPHVYIPMLPEDFLAFLKAPTVFIVGTHKTLLEQIGDELDDDILVVDINNGTVQNGYCHKENENKDVVSPITYSNSSMNIELPKHETSKLIRFLTPVSDLLYGSRKHDFHQLDLAFPVAPTPDMIEEQEQLQAQRLKKMKSHSNAKSSGNLWRRKNSDSLQAICTIEPYDLFDNDNAFDENQQLKADKKSNRFSLSFKKFKRQTLAKKMSLNDIGISFRGRSDSIEPPIKTYTTSPFGSPKKEKMSDHGRKGDYQVRRAKSEMTVIKSLKEQNAGTLQDIVESPINAVFDDSAVRNGFLRFWLSIFRSYQECLIPPNGGKLNGLTVGGLNEPIYEDSATTIDQKSLNNADTDNDNDNDTNNNDKSKSKSQSQSSMTSSLNSGTPSANALILGQSVNAIFDEEKFLKSSPSQSRGFLSIFLTTESFNRFITKCVFTSDSNPDVRYFNEKIIQKLGRSRFTKAQPTPFLSNGDYIISHEFSVPPPDIADLIENKRNGKQYVYKEWPQLNASLYTKGRTSYPKHLQSSKSSGFVDITSNYARNNTASHNEELSITFEPSKSQTITSTIIVSPPRITSTITPHNHNDDDHNIIREEEGKDVDGNEEKEDVFVLQLGGDSHNGTADDNPFSHDRVTYHLWFYIFIRTLQPSEDDNDDDDSKERALHLMIKIMAQMKNESVGLPDKWVFIEIIEAMHRMSWSDHVLKLVEVMHELQYELDATIYSALLNVLTAKSGSLETAYNILGNLPLLNKGGNVHVRDRTNSLLLNCVVAPKQKRRKYYETISELQNRFSSTFVGRSIIIKQECPFCLRAIHDVHIRMGWSRNDQSLDTQCPDASCNKRFSAKFLIREPFSEQYNVWFHNAQSTKCLKFFRMRSHNGTFVSEIDFDSIECNRERQNTIRKMISIGDQIVAINGYDLSTKSLDSIAQLLRNPPLSARNKSPSKTDESATAKLMAFLKSKKVNNSAPICVTFCRVIFCPYLSPLILYREIKKVIQNHAINCQNQAPQSPNSYRKKTKTKKQVEMLLKQTGISAISCVDFRIKHCQLFWNLAWHFSNLRLPIHFLQKAFQDEKQINTKQIDELIQFIPLSK